ncbi:uncharacterized protein A1O9_05508 [Exophiala aquamarina CBS 119918]|uniref:U6 small nuclear RNA (adenine-(43)-N(6))-methyltransferase n=1 Tax=Exophiala aquamarina CBS 119918 TaxID=1182545 RepID=A0A072PPZ1_9EURO|nr:uncharacterized protein A1O9_05508 [Exophiala aquamarina CBS 119918]KEF57590.1 hypothetical protein A1O9_05508 [Exophiala aquamarina CBS 119918]
MPAPDDIYKNEVDFTALALQYPHFAKRLKQNRQLDFSDPESVRQLTKSLLHRDFNLEIELPEDRLCPPVPNRQVFNYILFIQQLLDSTSPDFRDGHDPDRRVIGLDIGTGSSCIYPLLACRQRTNWLFLATEIDPKNRSFAEKNISSNDLQSRIKLIDTDQSGKQLIPCDELSPFERIDILLTNPPFYASATSMLESATQKSRPPNSSCTGAPVEMITPGGEVEFVSQLIRESTSPALVCRIQWFSSMLGKLSSVAAIVEDLKDRECTNYAVTELVQGQKTRRWCVSWSWMGFRPSLAVARGGVGGNSGVEKRFLPGATEVEFGVSHGDPDVICKRIDEEMGKLELKWRFQHARCVGFLLSQAGDVWSRKARRKQEKRDKAEDQEMKDHHDDVVDDDNDGGSGDEGEAEAEPGLVAKISVLPAHGDAATTRTERVHLRWLQGQDPVVFESFCGWLKRKLEVRA